MEDFLILVDEQDKPYGKLGKQLVHQFGLLHRAFSVFIFNSKGELLLQQRADHKYHSGGLWTNTCCSHPRFGEELSQAIDRRLEEEMKMQCDVTFAFSFLYKAQFDNGLVEHEFDHVYFGISDDLPSPNLEEAKDWKYIDLNKLENELKYFPENYTAWLRICFARLKDYAQHSILNVISKSNEAA